LFILFAHDERERDNLVLDLTTNSRCVGNSTMELSEDVFEQSLERRAGVFFPDIPPSCLITPKREMK